MKNRIILPSVILLVSAGLFCILGVRLVSHLHYWKGNNLVHEKSYDEAVKHLEKATEYWSSDVQAWKKLGEAYHAQSILKPAPEAYALTDKAKAAYAEAFRLNPLDAEAAFGLATQEARLERLYPYVQKDEKGISYNALPYFEKAIRLRPNGITCRYAFARYLHRKGEMGRLHKALEELARIHPSVLGHLKKELFWSPEVIKAVKKGLNRAVQEGISLHDAHRALSSLLSDQKDYEEAIAHCRKAMVLADTIEDNPEDYLHLGRLYIKAGQPNAAEEHFLRALSMSEDREKDLEGLYNVFDKGGYLKERYQFYDKVRNLFTLSHRTDILLARSLMDMGRLDDARVVLDKVNQQRPSAEAWYWLSRVAEKEKDWDAMEIAIQKATVLDPRNSSYHARFSQVLQRLKKLERAEKEAGLAIHYAERPSYSLFNTRAWLRWRRDDSRGALSDWEAAIALNPKKASFHAMAGEANLKLGHIHKALEYYEKALQLDPKKEQYRKRYKEIKTLASP